MFRANLPNGLQKIDNFQQTFPRAKAFQGGIALVCGLGGVAQYFLDKVSSKSLTKILFTLQKKLHKFTLLEGTTRIRTIFLHPE